MSAVCFQVPESMANDWLKEFNMFRAQDPSVTGQTLKHMQGSGQPLEQNRRRVSTETEQNRTEQNNLV